MLAIKQSYNQMKYVQHYLWDGILFLLISCTVSSTAKKKEEGKQFQESWNRVPRVRGSLPSPAHKSLILLTDFHPGKISLLCSETAMEEIITGLLPYLKNIYFRRAVHWASTRSPFLLGLGWRQQHGLAWGHWLPLLPRPL